MSKRKFSMKKKTARKTKHNGICRPFKIKPKSGNK